MSLHISWMYSAMYKSQINDVSIHHQPFHNLILRQCGLGMRLYSTIIAFWLTQLPKCPILGLLLQLSTLICNCFSLQFQLIFCSTLCSDVISAHVNWNLKSSIQDVLKTMAIIIMLSWNIALILVSSIVNGRHLCLSILKTTAGKLNWNTADVIHTFTWDV